MSNEHVPDGEGLDVPALVARGWAHFLEEDLAAALAGFTAAIRRAPDYAEA